MHGNNGGSKFIMPELIEVLAVEAQQLISQHVGMFCVGSSVSDFLVPSFQLVGLGAIAKLDLSNIERLKVVKI
jgi:hypothetical protein